MENIKFLKTDDNTTGLYCENTKDIFHSKSGALTEAKEKFIVPIKSVLKDLSEIKVLDICFGIGYNSKALLSSYPNHNILIDALEYYDNYVLLSPFIFDGINDFELRVFLLSQIQQNLNIDFFQYKSILKSYINENIEFFDESIAFFDKIDDNSPYKNPKCPQNNRFLHNIYYEYISSRVINNGKCSKYINSRINFHIGDARKNILNCNEMYDVVFLDAFSSQKDPTLWTIDFLGRVSNKINPNGLLVTYSKSTPVRSALKQLGFFVGKTYINDIDMGTVASFNKKNILNPLSEYDFELLKTRSGITYKDPTLSLSSLQILKNREIEQNNSNLISHTQFLKKTKT